MLFPCYMTTFLIFYLKLQNLEQLSLRLLDYSINVYFFFLVNWYMCQQNFDLALGGRRAS